MAPATVKWFPDYVAKWYDRFIVDASKAPDEWKEKAPLRW